MIRIRDKKTAKARTAVLKPARAVRAVSRETAGSSKAAGRTAPPPEKNREPAPPVTEEWADKLATSLAKAAERLVFPCSVELSHRLDAYWHGERLGSKSAAIRALLEDALKRWEKGRLE